MKGKHSDGVVSIDLRSLHEGTCMAKDFGKGDRRVVCKERGKLKIFELAGKNYA